MASGFTLIAHRGFSSRAPENTIAAFDMAIEAGFPNVELDAQLSKDGTVVVIHDDTVDRTTSGSGAVAGLTLEQLRGLDAAAKFSNGRGSGTIRIPTLAEVLVRYAGKAHLHLELKSKEPELPGTVAALLLKHGWLGYSSDDPFGVPGVTVTSFSLEHLQRSMEQVPELRHGWLVGQIDETVVARARDARIQGIYPRAKNASEASVGRARDLGFIVRGWGVADEQDLKRLFESGAQGTTVDWPDRARKFLDSLGG
jgi:glycerophosphoryl diester phosphodiesterase